MDIIIYIFSFIGLLIKLFLFTVGVITTGIILTGLLEERAISNIEKRQEQNSQSQ